MHHGCNRDPMSWDLISRDHMGITKIAILRGCIGMGIGILGVGIEILSVGIGILKG